MAEQDKSVSAGQSLKTIILICIIPVIFTTGGISVMANYIMARDNAIKRVEDHISRRRLDLNYISQLPTLNMYVIDLRLGLQEEAELFKQDTEKFIADYLKSLTPAFTHSLKVIAMDGRMLLQFENGTVKPVPAELQQLPLPKRLTEDFSRGDIPLPKHHFPSHPDHRLQDWNPLYNEINKQLIGAIVYEYGIPVQELLSPLRGNVAINAMLVFGTVLISMALTYWVLERNISPLRHLTDRVQKFTSGDLSQPVEPSGSSETRILASAFEAMRRQIKQQIEMLTRNAEELATSLTEQQRTQDQLKSERDYSAGIIEDSPNLVCGVDTHGAITFINRAGKKITGYDAHSLLGRDFFESFFDDATPRFVDEILKTRPVRRLHNHECDLISCNGNRRTMLWSSVRRTDTRRRLIEVILIGIDVTERKNVMNELRKFRTIADRSHFGSAIYGSDGRLTYINDAYAAMHGYRKEVLIGRPQNVFFGDDYAKEQTRLNDRLQVWGYLNAEETVHIRKDGRPFPVMINSTLVKDTDGNPLFLSETAVDISEKKVLEEQLQIRQRMDSLGTLAGGVAHDFNNLLSGIIGYLQLFAMSNDNLTKKQHHYLEELTSTADRATELIRQFQTLSNGSISKKQEVDLHLVSEEVISMISITTNRLIRKENKIAPGKCFVRGNPTELSQVLLNLGVNANEAIEDKAVTPDDAIVVDAVPVTIKEKEHRGLAPGDYIHLTFTDTGCGMSKSVKAQAFDPLFSTKRKGQRKGQGLGLAMVYNIIKNHNGSVSIESKPGSGTSFHIFLPAVAAESIPVPNDIELPPGTETILLVDDEKFIRAIIKEALTRLGYTVLTAVDGKEGLALYRRHRKSIDLVITDLIMPHMSGEMLLEEVLKIDPDERVLIISGHSNRDLDKTLLSRSKGFIPKPPDMMKLTTTLRRIIDDPPPQ